MNIIGCKGWSRASAVERMNPPRRTLKGRGMVITVKNIYYTQTLNGITYFKQNITKLHDAVIILLIRNLQNAGVKS